jgi:short-subunit dehydrogenase
MQISGTHVVVTGGSHGIGIELAREFASRGARVTVVGRDSARLEAVAADIDGNWIQVDLADEDAPVCAICPVGCRIWPFSG